MAGNTVYVQGSYVDVHDNEVVNLTIDKAGTVKVGDGQQAAAQSPTTGTAVSEKLKTDKAYELMGKLVAAEVLKEDWQPNGLSGSERGLVARAVCERLDISDTWQVFGQLWGEKPETLRRYFNKALEQKKSLDFQDRLKDISF